MTVSVKIIDDLNYEILKKRKIGYNKFVDFLSNYWKLCWLNNSRKSRKIKFIVDVPIIFSLKENPNESLKCLEILFSYRQFIGKKELFLNFSKCKKIDVSSSLLFLIILFNFRAGPYEFSLSGNLPKSKSAKMVLYEVGFLKFFFQNFYKEFKNYYSNIKSLDLIVGGSTEIPFIQIPSIGNHLIISTLIDVCSTISDFIDKNLPLTTIGKNSINRVVGELLTNFKEHLGNFSQFFISTFLSEKNIITISFIGLGDTIYKSLKDNSTDDIKKILEKFNEEFKEENKESEFDEELYWTLLALQLGISKELEGNNEKCRGRGMTSMLNFFFNTEISVNYVPEMTIISGRIKINFDKNDKKYYNNEKGIICFNDNLDLKKIQNSKKIQRLKEEFPGTLISMDFILKNEEKEG